MEKGKLIQKVGIITQKVAAELIALDEGDRVPTVVELSERYGVSRGTVQTAFSLLREEGAITLQPRGHMGTFLTFLDRIKLIEFAGVQTLVGVMPLPYSKKYEGLATGIYETLQNSGLSAVLAFMHGSDHRLEGLAERRYDFAVMSQLTAQYYIDRGEPVRIVENFGHYSYVGRHVLLVREDYDKTGIHRVGVQHLGGPENPDPRLLWRQRRGIRAADLQPDHPLPQYAQDRRGGLESGRHRPGGQPSEIQAAG